MKRLLAAFVIAALIHGLLLVVDERWLRQRPAIAPQTDVITMRLVAHAPAAPAINAAPAPPPSLPPKPKPPVDKPRKPKPITAPLPRPKPQPKPPAKPKTVKQTKPPAVHKPIAKPAPLPVPEPEPITAEPERDLWPSATQPETAQQDPDSEVPPDPRTPANATVVEAIPRYSQNAPPSYPAIARKRGYEGTVVLEVLVRPDGRVGDLRIITSSGHKTLDKSAMKTVKRWQFEPGRRGDETVAMWVRVPVDFRLQ
jgi:protein TonB